jgi:hypothetical protein
VAVANSFTSAAWHRAQFFGVALATRATL